MNIAKISSRDVDGTSLKIVHSTPFLLILSNHDAVWELNRLDLTCVQVGMEYWIYEPKLVLHLTTGERDHLSKYTWCTRGRARHEAGIRHHDSLPKNVFRSCWILGCKIINGSVWNIRGPFRGVEVVSRQITICGIAS